MTLVGDSLPTTGTAILIWGARVNLPLPIGTVYAFPPLLTEVILPDIAGTLGRNLQIPQDPALVGVPFAWQLWVIETSGALANSNGLEVLIG